MNKYQIAIDVSLQKFSWDDFLKLGDKFSEC